MAESQFRQATEFFYRGEYGEGLPLINGMISSCGVNSNLLLNRALFLSQLQNHEEARNSTIQALQLNPRNYIAYFNLFSLDYRQQHYRTALHHLLCSLSCLLLMKAKTNSDLHLADKAISYCPNNTEAHLLKGLLLLQQMDYLSASESLLQSAALDPGNAVLRDLKDWAFIQAHPDQVSVSSDELPKDGFSKLLKSNFQVEDARVDEEIDLKLAEFNQLYLDVGTTIDSVTELIPNEKDPLSTHHHRSHLHHSRDTSGLVLQDAGQNTPPHSEVRLEAAAVYLRQSKANFQERSRLSLVSMKEWEELKLKGGSEFKANGQKSECKSIGENSQLKWNGENSEFKSIEEDQNRSGDEDQFHSVIQQAKGREVSSKPSQTCEETQTQEGTLHQESPVQHCNLIYPLDQLVKLSMTVQSLELAPERAQSLQHLTDVYCILTYNEGKTKLRTQTTHCEGFVCWWNQDFKAVDIAEEPADLKIKVYNKKYDSYRDQYLGDIEVLITTADLLRLPVFEKRGSQLGSLVVKLRLEEGSSSPLPQVSKREN